MKDRNHAILSGKLGTGKQYLVNYYLYNHNVANYVILDCRNETTLVNTISSNEINHFVNNNNSEDSKQKSYQTFNLINEVKARILGYIELHSNIIIVFSNMNYENQYIIYDFRNNT